MGILQRTSSRALTLTNTTTEATSLHPTCSLLVLIVVAACNRAPGSGASDGQVARQEPKSSSGERWLLGPEPRADLIRADATEASLRTQFGTAAVKSDSIYVGEGMSEWGTRIFSGDSARELAIVWQDTVARAHAAYIYLTGSKATWQLYPGVGIGTDLKTLESMNGRAFDLSGFGWDYSGTTGSFHEGRLDTLWSRDGVLGDAVLLRLDPGSTPGPDSMATRVMGERTYSSANAAMQILNPRVYQILVRPR